MPISIGSILGSLGGTLAGSATSYSTGRFLPPTVGGVPTGIAASIAQLIGVVALPRQFHRSMGGSIINEGFQGVIYGSSAIRGVADRRKMSVAAVMGLPESVPATPAVTPGAESKRAAVQTAAEG